MNIVFAIIVGLIVGSVATILITRLNRKPKTSGTLRPAYDGGEVYLFLDLNEDPSTILKHDYVIFKVNPDDISQK